jgi:hypothetical protein
MILTGNITITRRENYPSVILTTTNHTWTDLLANPCLRRKKPATNRLSYSTAWAVGYKHKDVVAVAFDILDFCLVMSWMKNLTSRGRLIKFNDAAPTTDAYCH